MPPSALGSFIGPVRELNQEHEDSRKTTTIFKDEEVVLKWNNIFYISLLHAVALYAFLFHWWKLKFLTFLWGLFIGGICGFGVTGGAHRYWTHRSFKAKLPLQIILLVCYTTAGQNPLYDWVRDHRVHHKFSETNADPHNSKRGFFFAHVGWLMCQKHPDVRRQGSKLDMSDIVNDPVLQFHHRYFIPMKILLCFVLPTIVPPLLWNETWKMSIFALVFVRYVLSLNFTWLVNSAAHIWGNKPFDRRISPAENPGVAFFSMGEGWHNYHHIFPMDYKAAELGQYSLNLTTMLLDFFHWVGWAYDLKEPSKELVYKIATRYGDGTLYPLQEAVE